MTYSKFCKVTNQVKGNFYTSYHALDLPKDGIPGAKNCNPTSYLCSCLCSAPSKSAPENSLIPILIRISTKIKR